jgi:hypothetical protein
MGAMHELAVLDHTGDTKTVWDSDNADDVENARETFDRLRAKGHVIYNVKKDGEKGEVMAKFDKRAEKMIAVPRIVGG